MINIRLPERIKRVQHFNQYHVEYLLVGGYLSWLPPYYRRPCLLIKPCNENKKRVIDTLDSLWFEREDLQSLDALDFSKTTSFHVGQNP
jgi:hypothetical protein